MSERENSNGALLPDAGPAARSAPSWKSGLRRLPGTVPLYRWYLGVREQYAYLSRIARERYGKAEALFDDYQGDYSPAAGPEQERYRLILEAVAKLGGEWGDAIEIGCSKGLFTAMLAELCRSVVATDISPRACGLTAERCANFPNVTVRQFDIQLGAAIGQYDMVFVMDILAYVHGRRRLELTIDKLAGLLRPNGFLIFSDVQWPPSIRNAWWQRWIPEGADRQFEFFSKRNDLRVVHRQSHQDRNIPDYSYMDHLIGIFRKLAHPSREDSRSA
jgi:SAM-dependent methyltransferase